jgi:hypothetical protein
LAAPARAIVVQSFKYSPRVARIPPGIEFGGLLRDERLHLGADRVAAVLADLDCLEDCFERPRVANRLCVANKRGFDAYELCSQLVPADPVSIVPTASRMQEAVHAAEGRPYDAARLIQLPTSPRSWLQRCRFLTLPK